MVRAYLVSFLSRQLLFTGDAGFEQRYPNPWLVWEPGAWKVPGRDAASATKTMMPAPVTRTDKPSTADALCFELPRPAVGATQLTVGRSETNDLVLNDATVSREHLVLRGDEKGAWTAEVAPSSRAITHRGRPVPPGGSVALTPGDQLNLGDVVLTFLPAPELRSRLGAAARSPAK